MDAVRMQAWRDLKLEARTSSTEATRMEAFAWASSCTSGSLHGIPIWTYGQAHVLFETSRPECHTRALLTSYLSNIQRLKALLQGPLRSRVLQSPESVADDVVEPSTAFGSWKVKYLEDIQSSRRVLQDRSEEPTGTFITCFKCKSNAVDTEQKQTRSADEPMTLFCMCRSCGARFTMH